MGIQHHSRHHLPCNVSAVGHSILICTVGKSWLSHAVDGMVVCSCLMHNGKVPRTSSQEQDESQ